jgi:hypothetical protein
MLLGSIYEHRQKQTEFSNLLGFKNRILLIDYYELQTYFFHTYMSHPYNSKFNAAATKDFKFMFGKTYKYERVILAHKLYLAGMLDNSVFSCLLEKEHVPIVAASTSEMYNTWLQQIVDTDSIESLLNIMAGSIDSARFAYWIDENGNPVNHCPGYPYDHTLFLNTRVSIIPETFYFDEYATFVTEKTYRTIYNNHPFVLFGSPGSLQRLRDRNYETFSDFCNEDYDLCVDHKERMDLMIASANNLLFSRSGISDVTRHNHAQLIKNATDTIYRLNQSILDFLSS